MKKFATIAFLLMFSLLPAFGQTRHTADHYFHEGARYLFGPVENDTILQKQSLFFYSKSIKADRRFWRAYRNRARIYGYRRQYDKELQDWTMAIKSCTTKEKYELYVDRGMCYYEMGIYAKAIADIDIGIHHNETAAYLYLTRAKANWKLGLKNEACFDYNKAISINPAAANAKEFLICN